jgi:hypothetical protein
VRDGLFLDRQGGGSDSMNMGPFVASTEGKVQQMQRGGLGVEGRGNPLALFCDRVLKSPNVDTLAHH